MGCVNSTAATYPGNRRVAQPTYQPPDSDYTHVDANTAVANAHFVTCPGGNALRLEGKPHRSDGTNNNNAMGTNNTNGQPTYISVTLPPGVNSGDVIHVRAPDGQLNAITVPPGMGPGSTFTVEFSSDSPAPPKNEEELTPGVYVPTVMAVADEEQQPLVANGYWNGNAVVATAVPHVDNAFGTSNGKY
uniref:Uncharacterized protein n=1 Tax=Skeletonema marinoi TaxID=267567 RepID=A0A7S2LE45_9STRA|mmetsp:Transcript_2374/g.3794  ORF Transcript_2374/g.3794 Transcript_2374/m.3794 type:complete len:189 (+) Transcript_2374:202-768(+)